MVGSDVYLIFVACKGGLYYMLHDAIGRLFVWIAQLVQLLVSVFLLKLLEGAGADGFRSSTLDATRYELASDF